MKTRTLALPALLLMLVACLPVPAGAQLLPSQMEVNKWADRYLTEEPDQFERDDLIKKLSRCNRAMLSKSLKAAITTDGKRVNALKLATALKVPGLFDTAKKYADGDEEEFVDNLALATLDKGAAAWAFERWKTAQANSPSWAFADQAFRQFPVPMDIIKQFKDFASTKGSDEAKLAPAIAILAWQLGTEVPDVPADLLAQWDKLKTAYEADSKSFPLTGLEMFGWPDVGISGKRIFNNYRMKGTDSLTFEIPDDWDAASFTINMHIRLVSGSGFKLALMAEQTGQYLYINNKGEWSLPTGKGDLVQKAKVGDWTKVTIKVIAESKEKRSTKITVDDKEFHTGELPHLGALTYLTINAFETNFTIAGLEWIVGK